MIRLRKDYPKLGWGNYQILHTRLPHLLALRYKWRNNAPVNLHNFHEKPVSTALNVGGTPDQRLINLIVGEHSQAGPDGTHKVILEEYGYRWYRVGSLVHTLKREKY